MRHYVQLSPKLMMRALPYLLLVLLVGCGGSGADIAPVSGKVTLDGEPLAGASVAFEPVAKPGSLVAGPSAYGITDAQGVFQLKTLKQGAGASVGKCVVKISKWKTRVGPNGQVETLPVELIPDQYNAESTLTYEVPTGGSASADFALTSG